MRAVTAELYEEAIAAASLKPRFMRELRPRFDLANDWEDRDFWTATDRSGNRGIMWIDLDAQVYILPYSLSRGIIDKASGRARPVICDLCFTQQLGTSAARIGIALAGRSESNRSLLCCADLNCSDHVRGKTAASLRSKAQLRETISVEDRIARLHNRLRELVTSLGVQPVA